ncbi:AbrB/MazE/SpoVT family DNA-binding domain-containing protein [Sphingomonas hengshuiensis]|uniref:AbrB family transcriptional regulator n=1 Tax=Sphingomonas hengshuiensis TaxID=1609977 RepID=A0A7U4J8U5_9SPHN|nr:AbrB/MazE/SpoVT family DNA-binding domain-containing protein [Sphingomonas hengshuiensis]AJP72323.1 AbrB family transcriptional regulator [Sphingomonas hengshuiensis]
MSKQSRMTVKGQVTIPKDVRDSLGLKPNELVEIAMLGDDAAVIRKPRRDAAAERERLIVEMRAVSDRFAHLREGRATDEIMREIRGGDSLPA